MGTVSLHKFLIDEYTKAGRGYEEKTLISWAVREYIEKNKKEMAPSWPFDTCVDIMSRYMAYVFTDLDKGPALIRKLSGDTETYLKYYARYKTENLPTIWVMNMLIGRFSYRYCPFDALAMVGHNANTTGTLKFVSALVDNIKVIWDAWYQVAYHISNAEYEARLKLGFI